MWAHRYHFDNVREVRAVLWDLIRTLEEEHSKGHCLASCACGSCTGARRMREAGAVLGPLAERENLDAIIQRSS